MPDTAPLVRTLSADVNKQAATAIDTTIIGEVPFSGVVTSASYTAGSAIVGNDTNTRTLKVINRGTDGAGTTVVASLPLTVAGAGGTVAANDEKALTIDSARDDVSVGSVLAFDESVASGGLVNPGGLVQVEITRS